MSESKTSEIVLHGRLSVRVVEARDVEGQNPNLLSRLERGLTASLDGVDPYCSVRLGYQTLLRTPVVHNTDNPSWGAQITLNVCDCVGAIEFRVKAAKRTGLLGLLSKVKHLSMLAVPTRELAEQRTIAGWFPLGKYCKRRACGDDDDETSDDEEAEEAEDCEDWTAGDAETFGEICIELEYTPVDELEQLGRPDVPDTYFPLREGVRVSLFQNAEVTPGEVPEIEFRPEFAHGRCWSELARAIMASTELIYISGWALWPQLVMVRTEHEGDEFQGVTLGEMLVQKAEEGVRVCVLVWDEVASGPFYSGLMGTHDEQVIDFFQDTGVVAVKVSRQNYRDGPLADLNTSLLFTHHQKTVIVARTDEDDGRQRVEAWLGGLDLTDGRYDTPSHPLFRTLDGVHAEENFWNACAPEVGATSGPREPWHDIHAFVSGAAAWDVLENFESRWKRQAPEDVHEALHGHDGDTFVQPDEEAELADGDWNVQILRSINAASTELDSDRPGLTVRRGAPIDRSIHDAYVHHIRAARRFIYIENQYFLGSSHLWDSDQRGGFAMNLVPIELAQKICSKIHAGEPFRVYVCVPLFPEGPPASAAVQEILSHQRRTVETITRRIAAAIQEAGSDTTVSDWFNMFCLVNRESTEGDTGDGGNNEVEVALSESRRFMVYVHSKFAVFDDAVAIVGSANINSRSLDGSRDTEIAVAAWQPEHDAAEAAEREAVPQGDVAAFRAAVWAAHVGAYVPELDDPGSDECLAALREMAANNWEHFASGEADAVDDMPHGQLALYPYEFDEFGYVTAVQRDFPDFEAEILGQALPGIPNILTG